MHFRRRNEGSDVIRGGFSMVTNSDDDGYFLFSVFPCQRSQLHSTSC